jgi:hypothetical protein
MAISPVPLSTLTQKVSVPAAYVRTSSSSAKGSIAEPVQSTSNQTAFAL